MRSHALSVFGGDLENFHEKKKNKKKYLQKPRRMFLGSRSVVLSLVKSILLNKVRFTWRKLRHHRQGGQADVMQRSLHTRCLDSLTQTQFNILRNLLGFLPSANSQYFFQYQISARQVIVHCFSSLLYILSTFYWSQ